MKKYILSILILASVFIFISCSSLGPLMIGQKIDSSVPEEMESSGVFYIREVTYLHDGLLDVFDRDLEWFTDTELPSMMEVIGAKYDLTIIPVSGPSFLMPEGDLGLTVWIHEMKKKAGITKPNAVSVILTITDDYDRSVGKIMFIDQTGNSIINSDYAYAVFEGMIKRLAKG